MSELEQNGSPQTEQTERSLPSDPIGEIVFGNTDPQTLTRASFREAPDLLFHGASKEFMFERGYDYSQEIPHSHTIGSGFYTTDNHKDAVLFSIAFGGVMQQPTVIEVLPFNARIFDFRSASNPQKNASVPAKMFQNYLEFIQQRIEDNTTATTSQHPTSLEITANTISKTAIEGYFSTTTPNQENSSQSSGRVSRDSEYLQMLLTLDLEQIDLRQMLSLDGNPAHSEYASIYFANFILSLGYDGIVYREGGDHAEHNNPSSYVFFNLAVIGDFEAWHSEQSSMI